MSATEPTAGSTSLSVCVESPFATLAGDARHWLRYGSRMRRVIEHVHAHLDRPLDLITLAQVAAMSPTHWHRVYRAMFGETLAQTVKRLRLHQASTQLATTARPIARIAEQAGYPDTASFNRIFKSVYGLPPARFRSQGRHTDFVLSASAGDPAAFEIVLERRDALPIVVQEHRGSYLTIGKSFDLLLAKLAAAGRTRPGMRMVALFFDDPHATAEHDLKSWAAVAGAHGDEDAASSEADGRRIDAGLYAVLTHTGPYSSMRAAYDWLFGCWLPNSGYDPAPEPVVEEYLNSPRDTAPQELRTRIAVPVFTPGAV